jgi:molybdenum cofactor biosynthesis protein B
VIHNLYMGHLDHKASSPAVVRCFVVTISDTRTEATDTGGQAISALLLSEGHHLVGRRIVRDDADAVRETIAALLSSEAVEVIITTGGTGIASRDNTYEVISALLEKRLDGFGELFRMLSYQEIGSAAMLSRAVGGLASGKVILALPGSEAAVRLAMSKLVLPELGHLVREASR